MLSRRCRGLHGLTNVPSLLLLSPNLGSRRLASGWSLPLLLLRAPHLRKARRTLVLPRFRASCWWVTYATARHTVVFSRAN